VIGGEADGRYDPRCVCEALRRDCGGIHEFSRSDSPWRQGQCLLPDVEESIICEEVQVRCRKGDYMHDCSGSLACENSIQGINELVDATQVTNTQKTVSHRQRRIECQEDTPQAVENRELAGAGQVIDAHRLWTKTNVDGGHRGSGAATEDDRPLAEQD
jgi:hypothetical protein